MNKELLETILNATKKGFRIFFQNDNNAIHISVSKKLNNGGVKATDNIISYEQIENSEDDIVKKTIENSVQHFINFP